jgi:glyoxylase-like metal-dependent hydrolase (beta-lactamase superfamily II)
VQIEVFTSGIWQTTSSLIAAGGGCIVVDPAYFPRELDAIAARAAELGGCAAVVFTHGHWDHVMGHAALPGAPVWLSATLDASIRAGDPRAAKYLADAVDFDSRWYVPRPHGHAWPERRRALADGDVIGDLRVLHLPGHSPDGLGLVAGDTLLVGDYLSPCEIPFVDDAPAYRATLARLVDELARVREVIPGHGPRMATAAARAIAIADLAYLDGLLAARDRDSAERVAWPRAHAVAGMRDHHLDNVAQCLRASQIQ